jgi:hypothetical protein
MQLRKLGTNFALAFSLAGVFAPLAHSTSCTTQAQMTADQRDNLSNTSRTLVGTVQGNDMQALRAKIFPAVAGDFASIAASAQAISPLVQHATITVDALYVLDASATQAGAERTQFFCGSPTVVLTFDGLPQGTYGLSIIHATGIPKPQHIALILAKAPDNTWQLAGFYSKPMTEDGHDGVWYWKSARQYAQDQKKWDAWFYYHVAANLLDPVDFLSSPNLEKLQRETDEIHLTDAPGSAAITLNAHGAAFTVISVDTTTEFGALDLDLHYAPSPAQAKELRTPITARQQVTDLMTALLAQHPELREAFHGIWVHADHENANIYALELPMNGITQSPTSTASVPQ